MGKKSKKEQNEKKILEGETVENTQEIEQDEQLLNNDEKYNELYDKYLRLAAEYENFRKRTAKEKEDIANFVRARILTDLLVCLDNLERAEQFSGNNFDKYREGITLVLKQMKETFASLGVVAIESIGNDFDPEFHNAVMTAQSDEENMSGKVLEEFQKGYMSNDKVIRHSMVKVAE